MGSLGKDRGCTETWLPSDATQQRKALAYFFDAANASFATAKTQRYELCLSLRCVRCIALVETKL